MRNAGMKALISTMALLPHNTSTCAMFLASLVKQSGARIHNKQSPLLSLTYFTTLPLTLMSDKLTSPMVQGKTKPAPLKAGEEIKDKYRMSLFHYQLLKTNNNHI